LIDRGGSERAVSAFRDTLRDNGIGILPALWIDSVQWEGPIVQQWPSRICSELFFGGDENLSDNVYAHQAIHRFATRAFRGREPEPEFLEKLVRVYEQMRLAGQSREQAIKQPLAIVLSSPSFLYMSEMSADAPGKRRLDSLE
jgi:hypothetical protein